MKPTKLRSNHTPKSKWTIEEDDLLKYAVKKVGKLKWKQIAKIVGTRSGKQCRERWFTKLNPDIKNEVWSPEEDEKLLRLHDKIGNKWSQIAQHFPGRTVLNIKNRFRTFFRRQNPNPSKMLSDRECKDLQELPQSDIFSEFEQLIFHVEDFAADLFQ
ncbi:Myb-like DNA-binding domain containing protein [Trichomonas vaginalis G3]|uniref:Myb-like DNA-binding domain containing protein n=1 Tax=Trichomonas vaginalis (strain ATCC PRA-98 / G3) TaxID=412133 RepID=A2G1E2_TRIV3|nr:RNA polymerase II transcription regulator recruiting protein [Trichomonas vaginalis G3]EAX89022.1 Myb-like DNA-binding domain containing protein [Trichomonas vaginalis G3]KAI5552915.1 RNA polymerase II transcription regulator recruiting protein [Trichomonas vaginalis G3]|eukprot:XP_001301952.1 Myb-like DNA-binding domain containing protein [Trichomonas vaginalis G3]